MVNYIDVAIRAETGPMIAEEDFNMKLIAMKAAEYSKEIDFKFDPKEPVNTDNTLADEIWDAGLRFFLDVGIYSVKTRRRIVFDESEVKHALKNVKSRLEVGQGKDRRVLYNRGVEDTKPPVIFGGPFNCDVSEEMFVRFNEAYAREEIIDVLFLPGYLKTLSGLDVRPDSGLSSRTVVLYGRWSREAIARAGRPGMAIVGHAIMGLNEIGVTNEDWGLRVTDPRAMVMLPELQVDDVTLSRLVYYIQYGAPIYIAFTPLVGGFAGGPESTTIVATASHIAAVMLGGEIIHMGPQHVRYRHQTNIHSLWVASRVKQAVSRNSKMIHLTSHTTAGRAGSEQFLYEFAALEIDVVPSGSHVAGPRPADLKFNNHNSPLAARLFGEVGHAAAKLKRDEANELVLKLYDIYKDKIDFEAAPVGKPFEELYDVNTLKPKPEHYEQYMKVKKHLADLGLELEFD
ncbi:MAG: monomethylamine:corrinoid methyltransferase [Candidatus Asgardarchaeia archaeon]